MVNKDQCGFCIALPFCRWIPGVGILGDEPPPPPRMEDFSRREPKHKLTGTLEGVSIFLLSQVRLPIRGEFGSKLGSDPMVEDDIPLMICLLYNDLHY